MGRELKQSNTLPTIPAGGLPTIGALPPIGKIPTIPNSGNDPFLAAISRIIDFLNKDIANLQVKLCHYRNLLLHSNLSSRLQSPWLPAVAFTPMLYQITIHLAIVSLTVLSCYGTGCCWWCGIRTGCNGVNNSAVV